MDVVPAAGTPAGPGRRQPILTLPSGPGELPARLGIRSKFGLALHPSADFRSHRL